MLSRFLKSVGMALMLLVALSGTVSAVNVSELGKTAQRGAETLGRAGETARQGALQGARLGEAYDSLKDTTAGSGGGFYMSIYEDTARNPNRNVEEEIQKRFGIKVKVDLMPPQQTGPHTFASYFKDDLLTKRGNITAPTLNTSLRSACVAIRATYVDDTGKRWQILKNRLEQRRDNGDASAEALLEGFDDKLTEQLNAAKQQVPVYESLQDQQLLASCYTELSREVDFELQLQTILNPSKRQLKALQTFVNGRLDDFGDIPGTDVSSPAFPRYDLLFDLDVIDMIIFGSPVSTNVAADGRFVGALDGKGVFNQSFSELEEEAEPLEQPSSDDEATDEELEDADGDGIPDAEEDPRFDAPEGGFGTSSAAFAGPFCSDDANTGIELDFSELEPDDGLLIDDLGLALDTESGGDGVRAGDDGVGEGEDEGGVEEDEEDLEAVLPGGRGGGDLNSANMCDGTIGVDFGNEFLRLIVCINVAFKKVGKSWQTIRDEHCIACYMYKINGIWEDQVLAASVRPHKNTGTIMESSICEDGYGDDVGFHFYTEWVPFKLVEDICYPKGGVFRDEFAELVGYPEIVNRVNREGFYVNCEADFKDKDQDAVEACKDALDGKDSLDYDEFRRGYLDGIQNKITDIEDVDKDQNIWAKLVGDEGIAKRELHFFLYRLGQDEPQFKEDEEITLTFKENFKERQAYLKRTLEDIQRDDSLVVGIKNGREVDEKMQQLMCLKGYVTGPLGDQQAGTSQLQGCRTYLDTYRQFEEDVRKERERVLRVTERWNARSKDFNAKHQCGLFQGSGPADAFLAEFEQAFTTGSYYLQTPYRETQNDQEQVTAQIRDNSDLEDFDNLFQAIGEQVNFLADDRNAAARKNDFEEAQEKSIQLYKALATEFAAFRGHLQAFTNWWAEMVDVKHFVSKGGEKINVLQSFLEKTR